MAGGLQDIKRRIKSVSSTRQVTKAMEAVSASKMRKSVQRALTSRNYSSLGWQLIQNLARVSDESKHPLLNKRQEIKNILVIFITSDKGLCGGLNSQVIRQLMNFFKTHTDKNIEVLAIGKKGQRILKKINKNVIGAYDKLSEQPTLKALQPIARTALEGYVSGKYDQVQIIFTDFKSALAQKPLTRQLLPLINMDELVGADQDKTAEKKDITEYIFEPDPERLLEFVLPRLLEVQIYQALLESSASEHSSRMLAMRNATDSATEMIKALNLNYNQARQASITQEIAEISAGSAALEK